jgi:hypothetical protein
MNARGQYGKTFVESDRTTSSDTNWMLLVFLPGAAAALNLFSQEADATKSGKRTRRARR